MYRRRLLVLVGGMAGPLGGCSGGGRLPGQSTDSPTPSPPVESRVEVPPCPEKPDPLTRETVVRFAILFEKAYVTRQILHEQERVTYVDFLTIGQVEDDPNAPVTPTADGFIARFPVSPAYGYRDDPGKAVTAHADLPEYTATYFVTDETVRRAKATSDTPVDPQNDGKVVTCPLPDASTN